jgi:hypothetical protein
MKDKQAIVKDFFNVYEECANTFDADLLVSLYADEFMGGGPDGATIGKNDATWYKAISQRKELFQSVGFQKASLLDVTQTWLDDHYVWAETKWHMDFKKKDGSAVQVAFGESYFLHVDETSAKAVFFIAHEDEAQTMRKLGLME